MATTRARKILEYVMKTVPVNKKQDPSHKLKHILGVFRVGTTIGRKMHANMEVLEPALLLHDVVRPDNPMLEKKHALLSSNRAKRILPSFGYTQKEINKIVHAISAHSRSSRREEPKTLEAEIVYDADKLDGLGVIGVARARVLCSARGYDQKQTAKWYLDRIIDVAKNRSLYTQYGKRVANSKVKASLDFCRSVLGKDCNKILVRKLGNTKLKM
ncbi:MAG: HD domain-containing protein [Candidatus Aenigmatarchaeota archaeon]